jgi:predicted neutral ceramidase superfamily lipid hydrolase
MDKYKEIIKASEKIFELKSKIENLKISSVQTIINYIIGYATGLLIAKSVSDFFLAILIGSATIISITAIFYFVMRRRYTKIIKEIWRKFKVK